MLEGLTPPVHVQPCAVRTILKKLDQADQNILLDALANEEAWGNTALAKALTDRGLPISEKPIRKHRGGYCSCK
jgi:hypothetical protein